MDRRDFLKVAGGSLFAGVTCSYAFQLLASETALEDIPPTGKKWGMVIDLTRCEEGCTKCLDACRRENNVAFFGDDRFDVHWIRKVRVEPKDHAEATGKSVLLLCNHCENPPCAQVCPVQATYKRHDGIVIVDHHRCIGCRYCMIACPYNARMFNFKDNEHYTNQDRPKRSHGVAESCTLCAHRLDRGELPACVEACEEGGAKAIKVGDLNDPASEVSEIVAKNPVKRIREDLGTEPKVYYLGL
jgi:molybdopterin-containing oxidoreductase family iron-sulfur binding subunit